MPTPGWNVIVITLYLQQILAVDYCSNNSPDDVSEVKALKCKLGINQRQCVNWRIPVAIYMSDAEKTAQGDVFNSVVAFMKQASFYCDGNSYTQLYTPSPLSNSKCPKFHSITDSIYNNLTYNDVDQDPPGYKLYNMLYRMKECLLQTPLSSDQGGAAFVFTDITYDQMCDDMFLANSLGTLIAELISNKYSVVFQLFSQDLNEDLLNIEKLFGVCNRLNDCYLFLNEYTDDWSYDGAWFETCPRYGSQVPTGQIVYCSCLFGFSFITVLLLYIFLFRRTRKQLGRTKAEQQDFCKINTSFDEARSTTPSEDIIPDDWEIKLTDILLKDSEVLGYGAFGTVFKAVVAEDKVPLLQKQGHNVIGFPCLSDGTYEAAIKRLPEHSTDKSRVDLIQEIKFMKELGYHPHVISMLGCVVVNRDPMLVLEYCEHKDLLQFLRRYRGTFTDDKRESQDSDSIREDSMSEVDGTSTCSIKLEPKLLLSLAWQICDGMTYLVSKDVIHRDLAARNVLLNSRLIAKIGDFGMCRRSKDVFYTSKGGRLPVKWMAPESLKYFKFSTKTDVWSYGVVLFEVFSLGLTPFITVDPEFMCDYLEEGNRLPKVNNCPSEIYEIMEECWEYEPDRRPSFNQIRQSLGKHLHESDGSYNYIDLTNSTAILSSSP